MYGTVVDVGAVAKACKEVAPDPDTITTIPADNPKQGK